MVWQIVILKLIRDNKERESNWSENRFKKNARFADKWVYAMKIQSKKRQYNNHEKDKEY